MTERESRNISTVRTYLTAIQDGEAGDDLRRFFTEDVRQVELPNLLNKAGQESDLEQMLERSRLGLKILRSQRYEIISEIAKDDFVVIESRWTGVLSVGFGTFAPGDEIKASFAVFFQLRDGRIAVQRNYDCFDPW